MVERYSNRHRTTLAAVENIPYVGIYVIAYLGKVMYVGKAESSVYERLRQHLASADPIGAWMRKVQDDWENVRLDALEAPVNVASPHLWLREAERALVAEFNTVFNVATGG